MSELPQTKGNKGKGVSVWFRRSKDSLVLFVAFYWPRKTIERAIANTPGRVLPPQTEKQSAATQ